MFSKILLVTLTLYTLCSTSAGETYHKPKEYFPPIPYTFSYGVKDDYHGADFGQNEKSNGNQVQGSYTVQLPDGRRQTVNYIADHDRGFVAEVSYQGQARYPSKGAPAITFAPSKGYHK